MKGWKYLIVLVVGVVISGCVPKRFEWSPDGKWMTILSDMGLSICDANGKLLPGQVPGVNIATWFPDSTHLLICKMRQAATWAELQPLLSADDVKGIASEADRAKAAALTYDWTGKTWQNFNEDFDWHIDKGFETDVALYLRDNPDLQWQQKVPAALAQDPNGGPLKAAICNIVMCSVDASGIHEGQTLATLPRLVVEMRTSPTGGAALVAASRPEDNRLATLQLYIVSTSGAPPVKLPDGSSWYPDWSPDGNSVVFATASGPNLKDGSGVGTLRRERVIGDDGNVLDTPSDTADLVGIAYSPLARVRCQPDGHILFTSAQLSLPAVSTDLTQHLQLYSYAPAGPSVTRLFTDDTWADLGDGVEFFEVSPNGKWVSIPDSNGKVSVVEMATGNVTHIQEDDFPQVKGEDGPHLPSVPSWRADNQLTFAAPDNDAGNNQMKVMICPMPATQPSVRSLSDSWPKEMLEQHFEPSEQPTTQP